MKGKILRRSLLALLAITMILTVITIGSFSSSAATYEGTCGENVTWVFDNATGLLTISGEGAMREFYDSTGVPWYSYRNEILEVVIEDGVTSIGDRAFSNCSSLTSITIPDSVTSIGEYAFNKCSSLTSITIPDSVTSIGRSAFSSCRRLTSITLPFAGATKDGIENTHFGFIFGASSYSFNSSYVPSSLKTVTITGGNSVNAYAFYNCSSLTSITIPDGVTSIGEYAFYSCSSLTSITIPDGVTSIGERAFSDCSSLTSITIPDSVTSIGEYAFYSCSSFTSITIPDGVTSIGEYAFCSCLSLTSITIGDGVTSIGNAAFYNCSSLTTVYYGSQRPKWDEITFGYSNSALLNATIVFQLCEGEHTWDEGTVIKKATTKEEGIITYYCDYCSETKTESIPVIPPITGTCGDNLMWSLDEATGILTISGEGAMEDFSWNSEAPWKLHQNSIKEVVIENGVTSIGNRAFYFYERITSITIGDSVTSIGEYAFYYCRNLTSVTLPDGVTSIGNDAFYNCSSLTSITIPDSVTSIGDCAFSGCFALESIVVNDKNLVYHSEGNCLIETASQTLIAGCQNSVIPTDGSVTSIGDYAFYFCSSLISITIPDGVTSIGDRAFYNCSSLTSITIPDSVTSIGDSAFIGCSALESIVVNDKNLVYHSEGNCLIETASQTLIAGCQNSVIPTDGSVTSIGDDAFSNCSKLTSITIPDSVTSIGERAFYNCSSLTSITIGDSVTSIGNDAFGSTAYYMAPANWIDEVLYIDQYLIKAKTSIVNCDVKSGTRLIGEWAFYNCTSLTSITIPNSVTSIGEWAFYNCTSLTSITIPDAVTSIGDDAFYNCSSLTSITIPDSVTSIGNGAFYNCSNLTTVYYGSQKPKWDEITFGYSNSALLNATIVFQLCEGEHTWDEGTVIKKATTKEEGIITYRCDYCSETKTESIPVIPPITGTCGVNVAWSLDEGSGILTISGEGAMEDFSWNSEAPWKLHQNSIKEVVIENGVTSIGEYAFYDCSSLTSITIPDSVTSIGERAFYFCSSLTSITIPDSVTSIGNDAFDHCRNLTSVTLLDGVTSIGYSAFSHCTSLMSITIPDSVTSIGDYAFDYCDGLTSITIPNSVTSIGERAFSGCSSLTSITIGDSVTSIGERAFYFCSSLASIGIQGSPVIGDSAFYTNSSVSITFFETPISIYDSSDTIATLASIYCYADNDIVRSYAEKYGRTVLFLPCKEGCVFDQMISDDAFLKTPASCTQKAEYYMSCRCGRMSDSLFFETDYAHTFDQTVVSDEYVKTAATCTAPAVYYLSCVCGAYSDELTFEHGETLGHTFDNDCDAVCDRCSHQREALHNVETIWTNDSRYHCYGCADCGYIDRQEAHSYDDIQDTVCNVCDYVRTVLTITFVDREADEPFGIQYIEKGDEVTVLQSNPTKSGLVFAGWIDSQGTVYHKEDRFVPESDMILSAIWKKKCSTCDGQKTCVEKQDCSICAYGSIYVECYVCNGSGKGSTITCYSCGGTGLKVNAYGNIITCSTCLGNKKIPQSCSACGGAGGRIDFCYKCSGVGYIEKNVTCRKCNGLGYAKISHRISFDANGGDNAPSDLFTEGNYMSLVSKVPTKEGYVFVGWNTLLDEYTVYQPDKGYPIEYDVTLYAMWMPVCSTCNGQTCTRCGYLGYVKLSAPIVMSFTDTKIVLKPTNGYEYSMDGVIWQSSHIFEGLSPATEYTFYQRIVAEDGKPFNQSGYGISFTTDKTNYTELPPAPTVFEITGNSITLAVLDGCEYSMDGITWQTSPKFAGLSPATAYTFYQRYCETDTHYVGAKSEGVTVKTDKGKQTAPAAPILANRTHNRIELVKIDGYEYSMDGMTWQTSPIFEGLESQTNYLFYQRIAENETYYASPSSAFLTVKTDVKHTEGEWIVEKEPTCTEDGSRYCYCTDCGITLTETIPATGHTDGEWVVDKDSTCTEEGSKHQICSVCGVTINTETIEKKPHEYTSAVTKPTCTEQGYTTHTCHCGDEYVDTYVNALGHTDGEWIIDEDSTCTEEGSKHQICAVCGETIATETIEVKPHEYASVVTDPTCTEQGYTTYTCECGDSYVDSYVDALGHTDGEWIVDEESTCTEEGSKHQICAVCGETIVTGVIEVKPHEYTSVVTEPTCVDGGYTTHTCECGDEYVDSYVDALGHTDGEWIVDEDSTCIEEGSKHQICAVCGETIATGVIEVKPHEYTSVVTEPTCVDGGYTTHTCECGDSYVDSYVEAHGNHDYAVEDQRPEAGSLVGKLVYTCTVCGDCYEEEYVWAEITLSGSEFVTAWDLEFTLSLTAVTSIPEGRVFTLDYNTVMASFVSLDSSLVSYEWVEGELLLTALADISEGAVFAEITFRISDHLAEGEHFYLAAREDEGVTAEFAPIKIYEMGDVNLDGAINSRDAVLLQQFVVKMDVALGDRVTVTFVEGEEETVYTVREGEALTLVPEATDGCVWSLDRESYIVPDFKAIVEDMICYSRREG